MSRTRWGKRRRLGDGVRVLGVFLITGGLLIILRLFPIWLLWGLAAATLIVAGVLLLVS